MQIIAKENNDDVWLIMLADFWELTLLIANY